MTSQSKSNEYRKLPSVDELLKDNQASSLLSRYSRGAVVRAFREALRQARDAIARGASAPERSTIVKSAEEVLARRSRMSLRPAINATGIIIHTGLGRAVLSMRAIDAVVAVASGHSLLEVDVDTGKRGSRQRHVEGLLVELTGTESALVVNNNAGAVLLVMNSLALGKEVIISRGQLVEIGGSFRMPDIIVRAGARLVEVGTTNRTRIADYEQALTENSGLILRCHPSNFKITGFVEETPLEALIELGHRAGIPVADDLGSGALVDVSEYGLDYEPTVQESIKAGADVVTFSGDKLLGASQAGIILGREEMIRSCRNNPLARALRIDKLSLAALEATLHVYRFGDPATEIPVIAAISRPISDIERQARNLARSLNNLHLPGLKAKVVPVFSQVGGGSLPGQQLESRAVALQSELLDAEDLKGRFRGYEPPIFGRIVQDTFILDMRTVTPQEARCILASARELLL